MKKIRTSRSKQNLAADRMEALSASEKHSRRLQIENAAISGPGRKKRNASTIKKNHCYIYNLAYYNYIDLPAAGGKFLAL